MRGLLDTCILTGVDLAEEDAAAHPVTSSSSGGQHQLEDVNFCTLDPRLPADEGHDEPVHRVDWNAGWVDVGVAVPVYRRDGVATYGFTLPEEVWETIRVILSGALEISLEAKERVRKAVDGCHFVLQTKAKFADEEIAQRAPTAVYDCIRARMDQSLIGTCGMHIKSDNADAVVLWLSHSLFAEIPPSMSSFSRVLPLPAYVVQHGIHGNYVSTPCMDNTIPLFPAAEHDILPIEEYIRACEYSRKMKGMKANKAASSKKVTVALPVASEALSGTAVAASSSRRMLVGGATLPEQLRFQYPLLSHDTTLEDRKIYKTKGDPVFNSECRSASTPYWKYTNKGADLMKATGKDSWKRKKANEDFFVRKISGDEWKQLQNPENKSLRGQWVNGEMKCQRGIDKENLLCQYAEDDFRHEPRVPTDRPCREVVDPAGATHGRLAVGCEDELEPVFVEVSLLQLMLAHIAEVRRWTNTLHPSASFAAVLRDPSAEKGSEWDEMGRCWRNRAKHIRWGSSFAEPTVLAKYKQHIQLLPTWSGDDITVLILALISALAEIAPGNDDYCTVRARVGVCIAAVREIWHRVEVSYSSGEKLTAGEISRMNLSLYRDAEGVFRGLMHVDQLHLSASLRVIISGQADSYFGRNSRYGDVWQSVDPGISFWGNVLPVLGRSPVDVIAAVGAESNQRTYITHAVADAVEMIRIFRIIWPAGILPSHSLLAGDWCFGEELHGEHGKSTDRAGRYLKDGQDVDRAVPWCDSEQVKAMRRSDKHHLINFPEAVVAVASGRIAEAELPGIFDKDAFALLLAIVTRGALLRAPIFTTADVRVDMQSKVDGFGRLMGAEACKEVMRHIFDRTAMRYVARTSAVLPSSELVVVGCEFFEDDKYARLAGPCGERLKDAIDAAKGGRATIEQMEQVKLEQRRRCGSAGREAARAGVKLSLEQDTTLGGDSSGSEFLRQCRRDMTLWDYCVPLVIDEMVRTVEWLTADRSYNKGDVDVARTVGKRWFSAEDGRLKALRREMETPSETLRWKWLAMVELMKMPGSEGELGDDWGQYFTRL
eukprot:g18675.t1